MSTPAPTGSTRPDNPNFAGPTSTTIPAKPNTIPNSTRADGLCPFGRSQSTITIHSVTVATSSAAIPDGTVCSAQHTPPFPTISSSTPVIAAVLQCSAVGRMPVRHRKSGYNTNPTERCLMPARISGGNDCTPILMAKNVAPHKTYTRKKLRTTAPVGEEPSGGRAPPLALPPSIGAGSSGKLLVKRGT
jgi:hypothetical protein